MWTPSEDGQGLSAQSTGGAIKSAVVNYWLSWEVSGQYVDQSNGRHEGNPDKAAQLAILKKSLDRAQKLCGSNIVKSAYQETHEGVRLLSETWV